MKKSDLKDGMIIRTRGNLNAILLGDIFYKFNDLNESGCMAYLEKNYDENLLCKENELEEFDIMEVFIINKQSHNFLKDAIENLSKESVISIWKRPREIDWSKVPKWTKVQVRHNKKEKWENSYFLYESPYCHPKYKTSFGDEYTNANEKFFDFWNNCRIHPSVTIPEEWYKE